MQSLIHRIKYHSLPYYKKWSELHIRYESEIEIKKRLETALGNHIVNNTTLATAACLPALPKEGFVRFVESKVRIQDYLQQIPFSNVKSILEMGTGPGFTMQVLLASYPNIETYFIIETEEIIEKNQSFYADISKKYDTAIVPFTVDSITELFSSTQIVDVFLSECALYHISPQEISAITDRFQFSYLCFLNSNQVAKPKSTLEDMRNLFPGISEMPCKWSETYGQTKWKLFMKQYRE